MTSAGAYSRQVAGRAESSRAARAVIGPNAAIQLAAALARAQLPDVARDVFSAAGVSDWLTDSPTHMIAQAKAARLHQGVRDRLRVEVADAVLTDAGRLTADYIIEHRIPFVFRRLLQLLPRGWSQRLLLEAIRKHAWTFVGTGRFAVRPGSPTILEIQANPLCARERRPAPVCQWHAAVFERLFRRLVNGRARIDEIACSAAGDTCCQFALSWTPPEFEKK